MTRDTLIGQDPCGGTVDSRLEKEETWKTAQRLLEK